MQSRPLPHVPAKGPITSSDILDPIIDISAEGHAGTLLSQSSGGGQSSNFEITHRWTSKENLLAPGPEEEDPQLFVAL